MTNTAVPKLRFPEFEGAGDWEEKKLGELTYPISERNKADKKLPIYSISNVNGFVPQSSQFEGVDSHKRGYNVSLYKVVGGNTFAYNPARINIGSIGYSGELNEVLISSLYVCFQTNDKLNDTFLLYFLKSAAFNQAVNDTVEGGISSYLFYDNLAIIKIQVPSLLEQQKISAALSSLDDLITVQSAKLVALQAHKRGLMQGLFPAEGETVPKLRFPEFLEAAGWKKVKLSTQVELISGLHLSPDEYAPQGDIPYFSGPADFANDLALVNKWTLRSANIGRAGDTLITVKGSGAGGLFHLEIDEVALGRQLMAVRALAAHSGFISHFLATQKQRLASLATGNLIPGLSRVDILGLNMLITSLAEQQKIAATLTSLDNRITTQTQQIEALKLHKKGLMQGLFPAAAEPTA